MGQHCGSCQAPERGGNTDPELIYPTDSGIARDVREFDFDRYELSKDLPGLIRALADKRCKHTGKGNYLRVELIDSEGATKDYEIYFTVTKGSKG